MTTRVVGKISAINILKSVTVKIKEYKNGIVKNYTYNVHDKWESCGLNDTVIIKKLDIPIRNMNWEVVEITTKYRAPVV